MPGFFNLAAELSPAATADEADVIKTKHYLVDTGDLEKVENHSVNFADEGLFNGLKKFQKKNKLATDGIMRPGGPTEAAMDKSLSAGRFNKIQPLRKALDDGCKGVKPAVK